MQVGPGTRIRHAELQEPGTLGCILRSRDVTDPRRFLLSAAHVLNPGGFAERRDVIEAEVSLGHWRPIARLDDWTPINGLSADGILIDAAIAELMPEFAETWAPAPQALAPAGVAGFTFPGMALRVFGARTGRLSAAELRADDTQMLIDYRRENSDLPLFAMQVREQISYGNPQGGWRSVTQGGDSGALVVDRFDLAVGLHIGSTNAGTGVNASVCTPMQRILDRFNMVLDVGQASAAPLPAATPVPASGPIVAAPAGATTAEALSEAARISMGVRILPLLKPHRYQQGVSWQLTPRGVMVDGQLPRTGGQPVTVARMWIQHGEWICESAAHYQVPVELIVATICTESHGNPRAFRHESGGRMSVGLMQTLIGTAREVLSDNTIDEAWLREPRNSIAAGTACIAGKRHSSELDPPLVAAIYNAGSLRPANDNRWQFAQHVGGHAHVDAFVEWFNDCCAYFEALPPALDGGVPSFWKLLRA